MPLHYPEISLTEGTENSSMERNIETVHEGENIQTVHEGEEVKPIMSKHLVCEKTHDSQDSLKSHVAKSELIQKENNELVDLKKFHFFKSNNSQIPECNSSLKIQENGESNDRNFLEPTIHKGKKTIPR